MKNKYCPVCQKKSQFKFGSYYMCKRCKTLYLVEKPQKKQIKEAIDKDAIKIVSAPHQEEVVGVHKERLEKLSKFLKTKSRILDVGAGGGIFLSLAKDKGHIVFGLDIAEEIVNHLKKQKIPAVRNFNELPKEKFDAVTGFDVLEHTVSPRSLLVYISRCLKKDGILMLTTPNSRGISARILREEWWVLGPEAHFIIYSPQSLQLLLKKNGFVILETNTDTITEWLVPSNEFYRKMINKIVYTAFLTLKVVLLEKYLGDNINVIAKKV